MNLFRKCRRHKMHWWQRLVLVFAVYSSLPFVATDAQDKVAPGTKQAQPVEHTSTNKVAGALINLAEVNPERLEQLSASGSRSIILKLTKDDVASKEAIRLAATTIHQVGLDLGYWVEVARVPQLADEHPDWMASLQTHDQWRRYFPSMPKPKPNEVIKTYPWVPILSRAPYKAQRKRVLALLSDLPRPKFVFLNDLQGAPSACGCGNPLCRWTSDYGPRRTTVPMADDVAALFTSEIQRAVPSSEVIPVWTTECERHEGHPDGLCAGVGCFQGICWKAYTRQLMPLAATADRIAVLALYKEFQRNTPFQRSSAPYGDAPEAWVKFAIKTFETMPPRHQGMAIPASRVVAILQGWDISEGELIAQRQAAEESGAAGIVIAFDKIEQSWSPKMVSWKSE